MIERALVEIDVELCAFGGALAGDVEVEFPVAGHVEEQSGGGEGAVGMLSDAGFSDHAVLVCGHGGVHVEGHAGQGSGAIGGAEDADVEREGFVEGDGGGFGSEEDEVGLVVAGQAGVGAGRVGRW